MVESTSFWLLCRAGTIDGCFRTKFQNDFIKLKFSSDQLLNEVTLSSLLLCDWKLFLPDMKNKQIVIILRWIIISNYGLPTNLFY